MHVYKIVYGLLEKGGLTYQQIADEVRRQLPEAQTTAKSIASHAVAWRRQRSVSEANAWSQARLASRPRPLQQVIPEKTPTLAEIVEIVDEARALAIKYYRLTGRPLGITGEVGEYEAAHRLGLALAPARAPGYDAIDGMGRKLQVKTRSFRQGANPGQRLGSIKLDHEWDAVLLVLLDEMLVCQEIWEGDRSDVEAALLAPGSRARNERGALAISKFKAIGRLRWHKDGTDKIAIG
jgi:hypothetical protein